MAKDLRTISIDGISMNSMQLIDEYSKDITLGSVSSGGSGYSWTAYTATEPCTVMGQIYAEFPAKSGGSRRLSVGAGALASDYRAAMRVHSPSNEMTQITAPVIWTLEAGESVEANMFQNSGSAISGMYIRAKLLIFTPPTDD